MQIINVARVLVINDKGEALVLKRSLTDSYKPGMLDYPGGGIDEGEAPSEAASRELEEEAGLKVRADELQLIYASTRYEEQLHRSVNRLLYVSRAPSGLIRLSSEHIEHRWVPVRKLKELFPHPVYSAAIEYAMKNKLLPGLALHR